MYIHVYSIDRRRTISLSVSRVSRILNNCFWKVCCISVGLISEKKTYADLEEFLPGWKKCWGGVFFMSVFLKDRAYMEQCFEAIKLSRDKRDWINLMRGGNWRYLAFYPEDSVDYHFICKVIDICPTTNSGGAEVSEIPDIRVKRHTDAETWTQEESSESSFEDEVVRYATWAISSEQS